MSEGMRVPTLALCCLAARVLGWRPTEFWDATPAELAAALGLSGEAEGAQFDHHSLKRIFGAAWPQAEERPS